MINNLQLIAPLLTFESDDEFYHLQILKRKKEHPELKTNSVVLKTHYIYSLSYLREKMDGIVNLCDYHNARAYINLNVRSFENCAFNTLKKITDIIMNKDYRAARKAYESVCGAATSIRDKKWILDWDQPTITTSDMTEFIFDLQLETKVEPLMHYLPTPNGWHIITRPFNLQKFRQEYPESVKPNFDIHKNNPTILYSR